MQRTQWNRAGQRTGVLFSSHHTSDRAQGPRANTSRQSERNTQRWPNQAAYEILPWAYESAAPGSSAVRNTASARDESPGRNTWFDANLFASVWQVHNWQIDCPGIRNENPIAVTGLRSSRLKSHLSRTRCLSRISAPLEIRLFVMAKTILRSHLKSHSTHFAR